MGTHPIRPGYAGIPTFSHACGQAGQRARGDDGRGRGPDRPGHHHRQARRALRPAGDPGGVADAARRSRRERGAHLGRRGHRRCPPAEGSSRPPGRRRLRHRPHRHHEDDVVGGGGRGRHREARRAARRPRRRSLHRLPLLRGLRSWDERAEGEPWRRVPARRHALGLPLRIWPPRALQSRDLGPAGQREPGRVVPEHRPGWA